MMPNLILYTYESFGDVIILTGCDNKYDVTYHIIPPNLECYDYHNAKALARSFMSCK